MVVSSPNSSIRAFLCCVFSVPSLPSDLDLLSSSPPLPLPFLLLLLLLHHHQHISLFSLSTVIPASYAATISSPPAPPISDMESHAIGAISVAAFSAAWAIVSTISVATLFTGWESRSRMVSRGRMISWMKWKKDSRQATGSSTHCRDTSGHRMTSNHPRQNMNVRSHMAASRKPFSRFYLGLAGSKLSPRLTFKTQKQPKGKIET